jgi:hypothetical protein
MSRPSSTKPTPNGYLFEVALFLLTAARGCVDEPHMYGPLRLVDGISRLVDLIKYDPSFQPDPFLDEAKRDIDAKKYLVMQSEEKFVGFLDDLIRRFVREQKARIGQPG